MRPFAKRLMVFAALALAVMYVYALIQQQVQYHKRVFQQEQVMMILRDRGLDRLLEKPCVSEGTCVIRASINQNKGRKQ